MVVLNDINRYTTYVQHKVRHDVSFEEGPSLQKNKFILKGFLKWILLKVYPMRTELN